MQDSCLAHMFHQLGYGWKYKVNKAEPYMAYITMWSLDSHRLYEEHWPKEGIMKGTPSSILPLISRMGNFDIFPIKLCGFQQEPTTAWKLCQNWQTI